MRMSTLLHMSRKGTALLLSVNCSKVNRKAHLFSANFPQRPPNYMFSTAIYQSPYPRFLFFFFFWTHDPRGLLRPVTLFQSSLPRATASSSWQSSKWSTILSSVTPVRKKCHDVVHYQVCSVLRDFLKHWNNFSRCSSRHLDYWLIS